METIKVSFEELCNLYESVNALWSLQIQVEGGYALDIEGIDEAEKTHVEHLAKELKLQGERLMNLTCELGYLQRRAKADPNN